MRSLYARNRLLLAMRTGRAYVHADLLPLVYGPNASKSQFCTLNQALGALRQEKLLTGRWTTREGRWVREWRKV